MAYYHLQATPPQETLVAHAAVSIPQPLKVPAPGLCIPKEYNFKSIFYKQIPHYVPFSSFVLSYKYEMSKI